MEKLIEYITGRLNNYNQWLAIKEKEMTNEALAIGRHLKGKCGSVEINEIYSLQSFTSLSDEVFLLERFVKELECILEESKK